MLTHTLSFPFAVSSWTVLSYLWPHPHSLGTTRRPRWHHVITTFQLVTSSPPCKKMMFVPFQHSHLLPIKQVAKRTKSACINCKAAKVGCSSERPCLWYVSMLSLICLYCCSRACCVVELWRSLHKKWTPLITLHTSFIHFILLFLLLLFPIMFKRIFIIPYW